MKLVIDISEYNREWINNGYRIPQEINLDITRAIVDGEVLEPERKMGKWIYHPEIGCGGTWLCSECGEKTVSTVMGKPRYKWCPMCGSKMTEDNQ